MQLPWSIQNIIQRASIPIYREIFTFLIQIYRVNYLLQHIRIEATKTSRSPLHYKLLHRLTWFADMLRSYLTETVIFFTTRDMKMAVESAADIDEMSQIHAQYVAKLQERALLSKDVKPIHKAIIELLDLGVLFAQTQSPENKYSAIQKTNRKSLARRKSSIPILIEENLTDEDEARDNHSGSENTPRPAKDVASKSPREVLQTVDEEFGRLLPFITAGLRSVGRVGAEPMWEQLADRLEWEEKKDRMS
jgi:gamma-tubulin complex component 5